MAQESEAAGAAKALRLVAILGVGYFGLAILLLSLFDGEFNPITDVASLYGIGQYAIVMNSGFFIGGMGMISFALTLFIHRTGRSSRVAPFLLFIAGLILMIDSYFTTSLPGSPPTLHNTIHGFGGLIFFLTGPLGVLLVARKIGRIRLLVTIVAVLVGVILLAAPINTGGLAERIIIWVVLGSVIVDSIDS